MKKLLIVEDHIIVRQGIIRLLQDVLQQPLQFDEASDGYSAIARVTTCQYDLILLDISLPDISGLDVLKALTNQKIKAPVVILSTYPDEQYAVRAFRAGASAYVNKSSRSTILKEAIEAVLSGRKYVSPIQSELLVNTIRDDQQAESMLEKLSDRELQMVGMMCSGKTLTEIARDLSLSVKTIGTYRARILEKLDLKTTADIISYGIRNNVTG